MVGFSGDALASHLDVVAAPSQPVIARNRQGVGTLLRVPRPLRGLLLYLRRIPTPYLKLGFRYSSLRTRQARSLRRAVRFAQVKEEAKGRGTRSKTRSPAQTKLT